MRIAQEDLDMATVYGRLIASLSAKNRSVSQLSSDDPFNLLIGFIALYSVIASTYVQKIIENKYIRYPIIDRKSNLNVLENFGIRPSPIIPSSITINLEYTAGLSDRYIVIPPGTRFKVLYDEFLTFEQFYILPYSSYATVTAYKGSIREEEFSLADIVNQRIELGYHNVYSEKVEVSIDGTPYQYIDHCLYRSGTGIFGIEYEYPDQFCITFPANYREYVLTYSRINVRYLTADSTISYDPSQETIELSSPIYDENQDSIGDSIEIYNLESFSYGDSRHDVSFCYKNLGKLLSTFGKAVTTEDYKILTDYYPGVAVSAAYDINSERRMDPLIYIQIPYYTKIVVAPTENYYPTEYLKKELYKYYDKVGIDRNQIFIQIIDPRYRLVDVAVMVHTKYLTPSEVLDSYNLIYESIKEFFRVGNLEFGSTITEDVLLSVIISSDTKLMYSEDIAFRDFFTVYCEADELPILGRLSITFNYEKLKVREGITIADCLPVIEREYREPMATAEGLDGVLLDRLEAFGPYFRDTIYISDEIYKDSDIHTDITIIRYTNVISRDLFRYSFDSATAEDHSIIGYLVSDSTAFSENTVIQLSVNEASSISDNGNMAVPVSEGISLSENRPEGISSALSVSEGIEIEDTRQAT